MFYLAVNFSAWVLLKNLNNLKQSITHHKLSWEIEFSPIHALVPVRFLSPLKNFREINSLVKTLIWRKKNVDFTRKNCDRTVVVEITENLSHTFLKKISWKQRIY